jgi:hypothetical protein
MLAGPILIFQGLLVTKIDTGPVPLARPYFSHFGTGAQPATCFGAATARPTGPPHFGATRIPHIVR